MKRFINQNGCYDFKKQSAHSNFWGDCSCQKNPFPLRPNCDFCDFPPKAPHHCHRPDCPPNFMPFKNNCEHNFCFPNFGNDKCTAHPQKKPELNCSNSSPLAYLIIGYLLGNNSCLF